MATKVNNKNFRALEPAKVQIMDIYPHYRSGWNDGERKFKNFFYFPDSIKADVFWQGEERPSLQEGESQHLRLEEYDQDERKFKFTKVAPPNYDFFKLYKKVYDIDVVASAPVDVRVWDKEAKAEVIETIPAGETMRIVGFPATRIQGIAQAMMLTKGITKVEAEIKDRLTGEKKKEMRLPFNWEDGVLEKMVGAAFEFAVNGTGMDTRYAFSKVEPFVQKENVTKVVVNDAIDVEDMPF